MSIYKILQGFILIKVLLKCTFKTLISITKLLINFPFTSIIDHQGKCYPK